MNVDIIFATIGLLLLIGYGAQYIFHKTNIPDVLFLIIIGIILRAITGESIDLGVFGELFTTFALIYIIFQGALGLQISSLIRSIGPTVKLTILGFVLTVASIFTVMFLFNFSWEVSLLMGFVLGGTSAIVIIPILKNIQIKESYSSTIMLESALSDVLCIIATLTMLKVIQSGSITVQSVFSTLFLSFLFAVSIGLLVGIIWSALLSKFETLSQAYMLTIGVLLLVFALVESPLINANGALACLVFGIVVGNSKKILHLFKKHTEEQTIKSIFSPSAMNFFAEVSFFIKVTFFVYLGMIIDFSSWYIILIGFLLTCILFAVRPLAIKILYQKEHIDEKSRTIFEIMIPKGLAAAVLAQVAASQLEQLPQYAQVAPLLGNLALSIVFFSIVFTSAFVFGAEHGFFKGLYYRHSQQLELMEKLK